MGMEAVVSGCVAALYTLGIDERDATWGCYRLCLWVVQATVLCATGALARRSKAELWVLN